MQITKVHGIFLLLPTLDTSHQFSFTLNGVLNTRLYCIAVTQIFENTSYPRVTGALPLPCTLSPLQ